MKNRFLVYCTKCMEEFESTERDRCPCCGVKNHWQVIDVTGECLIKPVDEKKKAA